VWICQLLELKATVACPIPGSIIILMVILMVILIEVCEFSDVKNLKAYKREVESVII